MSQYGTDPQQPTDPYGTQPQAPHGQPPSYGSGGGGYGGPPSSPVGSPVGNKNFVGALFDLSFTTFVTPMIIKVVYIIGLVVIGLATLFFAFSGFFSDSPALGIVTIIVGPLVGLLYLCLFRMMCEFYLAITRMSEDINRRLPRM